MTVTDNVADGDGGGMNLEFSALPQLARLVVTLEEARWRPAAAANISAMRRLMAEVAGAPAVKH